MKGPGLKAARPTPTRRQDPGYCDGRSVSTTRGRLDGAADQPVLRRALGLARALVAAQDLRARRFRAGLFADPAWNMLLDLFIARLEGRAICVSSLCIAARVPATTAHRWIRGMEQHGEIVRRADPIDGRRFYLAMSDQAFMAMLDQMLEMAALLDRRAERVASDGEENSR